MQSLQAVGWTGTLATINANKEVYRVFLVALSETLGFDGEKYTRLFLDKKRTELGSIPRKIIWDNVRYPEQYAVLQGLGFILIRLGDVNQETQQVRSKLPIQEIRRIAESRGERPLPRVPLEISVNGACAPKEVLREVVDKLAEVWAAVRATATVPLDVAESNRLATDGLKPDNRPGDPWTPVRRDRHWRPGDSAGGVNTNSGYAPETENPS